MLRVQGRVVGMRALLLIAVVIAVVVVPSVALMQPRASVDGFEQIFGVNSHIARSQFAARCGALHGTLPGTVNDSGMAREVCRVSDADFVSVGFCSERAFTFLRVRHVAGDAPPSIRAEAAAVTRAVGVQPTHDMVSLVTWRSDLYWCELEASGRDGRTPASISLRCMSRSTPPCMVVTDPRERR